MKAHDRETQGYEPRHVGHEPRHVGGLRKLEGARKWPAPRGPQKGQAPAGRCGQLARGAARCEPLRLCEPVTAAAETNAAGSSCPRTSHEWNDRVWLPLPSVMSVDIPSPLAVPSFRHVLCPTV